MQVESSQLLFFAFSAASLITAPVMAFQVKKWRTKTLELLVFGLVGGVSNAILHYSLLNNFPIAVLSLFGMAAVGSFFVSRLMKSEPVAFGEFLTILSILLAAIFMMLETNGLKLQWSQLLAILAGVGFHRLVLINEGSNTDIPILSRVAAIFIASTWFVGMMLIFSPRANSFPLENAALFSALYGLIILLPIIFSIVFILTRKQFSVFLFWVTLLLGFNLAGVLAYLNIDLFNPMLWLSMLLILGCGIRLVLGKNDLLEGIKSQ